MKTTAALLVLVCLSCTISREIRTSVDRAAIPAFRRVLLVSKMPTLQPNYLQRFAYRFPAGYDVCTLEAGILTFGDPDSLIRNRQQQCQSEVMLTIEPYNNYARGSGHYISGYSNVLFVMTDLRTNRPFWKGLGRADGGDLPNVAYTLQLLKTDGILTGNIRTPAPPAQ